VNESKMSNYKTDMMNSTAATSFDINNLNNNIKTINSNYTGHIGFKTQFNTHTNELVTERTE